MHLSKVNVLTSPNMILLIFHALCVAICMLPVLLGPGSRAIGLPLYASRCTGFHWRDHAGGGVSSRVMGYIG